MERWHEMSPAEKASAIGRFHKPMAVLAISLRHKVRDSLGFKVKQGGFNNWLYRMDNQSHTDVRALRGFIRGPKVHNVNRATDELSEIRRDFFSKVLRPGDRVSIPDRTMLAITDNIQHGVGSAGPGPRHPPYIFLTFSFVLIVF